MKHAGYNQTLSQQFGSTLMLARKSNFNDYKAHPLNRPLTGHDKRQSSIQFSNQFQVFGVSSRKSQNSSSIQNVEATTQTQITARQQPLKPHVTRILDQEKERALFQPLNAPITSKAHHLLNLKSLASKDPLGMTATSQNADLNQWSNSKIDTTINSLRSKLIQ